MDETGITLMAFPRGNKDPQSHPSAVIPGLIYCITLSKSLTHRDTQTTYASNTQRIQYQKSLNLHKVKQKERKK